MLKIYGADLSTPANKIRFVANALGLKYEYIRISIREKENQKPEYLKIHPAGKIPAINDDGFILFESNAIIRYLACKQKSDLYPQDLKQRSLIDQWMDFASLHVAAAMNKVVFNRLFASVIGVPVDEQSLNDGLKFLHRFLPVVDNQLGKEGHFGGKALSLADFSLLAALDAADVVQIDLAAHKNIVKWRNALQQKDFYTKCYRYYGEVLQKMMAAASK